MSIIAITCGAGSASAATNLQFIDQAFQDLLNRPPTEVETNSYVNALGTATRQQVAYSIETTGLAFDNGVVDNLFLLLLHRSPAATELNNFALALSTGETFQQIEATIAGTTEYFQNRGGNSDSGFVTAIYSDFLDETPAITDLESYDTELQGGSSAQAVAAQVLATPAYQDDLLNQWTMKYLHGPLDDIDEEYYLGEIQSGVKDQLIISQLVGSQEYFTNLPEPGVIGMVGMMGIAVLVRRPSPK
ncbi:MAG TPA: hypothetical protein VGG19_17875 [Tepidisphaeraceae bacterium]|jgi:hypothetical protein